MQVCVRAGDHMNVIIDVLKSAGRYVARVLSRHMTAAPHRISYSRLAKAVCDALRDNRDEIGRRVLLPNVVHLYCSPEDREIRKSFEDILIAELKEELAGRAREWDAEITPLFFRLELHTDESLRAGECYAGCFFDYGWAKRENKNPHPRGATLLDEDTPDDAPGPEQKVQVDPKPVPEGKTDFQPLIHDDCLPRECRLWAPWKEGKAGCMVKVTGPNTSESLLAPGGRWYIGRGKLCQVVLESADKKISRRHIEVDVSSRAIRLKCLGLNGALINDREMPPDEWINALPGDSLFIGQYQLRLSRARIA